MDDTFPIKGRYILAIWLLPFLYLPGLNFIYEFTAPYKEWYWTDIAYYFYYYALFAALLTLLVYWHKINWRLMFQKPDSVDYLPSIKLTVFILIFSIAATYALFR